MRKTRNHGRVCVFIDDYRNKEKIKNNIGKSKCVRMLLIYLSGDV